MVKERWLPIRCCSFQGEIEALSPPGDLDCACDSHRPVEFGGRNEAVLLQKLDLRKPFSFCLGLSEHSLRKPAVMGEG